MNFFGKAIRRIKIEISRRVGPVMVDGWTTADGLKLKNVRYGSTTYFQYKDRIEMSDHVFIAQYSNLDGSRGLKIGEGCQIGFYVMLTTHSSHKSIRLYGSRYPQPKMIGMQEGSVDIGAYSFIGPHSIVMPNTKIGKGSIVAAYSYVSGKFPDFAIISGNPAKVVGDTRKIDAKLLKAHPDLQTYYNEWAEPEASHSDVM